MRKQGTEGSRQLESTSAPRREQCHPNMIASYIGLRILPPTVSQSAPEIRTPRRLDLRVQHAQDKRTRNPYFLAPRCTEMLAKKTSKNQLTLPKAVVANYPDVEYFDVRDEDGRIVLVPLRANQAEAVREKLEQLGIRDEDIDAAVKWARSR